jgi:xanthine dehydrogenase iron-sulfur cluster and FAD-binding subunit A
VLAREIRTYHRPSELPEALELVRGGAVPLAGGTRLLASSAELPEVVDLCGLGLARIAGDRGDLRLGAMTPLQDVIDSAEAYGPTAGLLPVACRARSASRMVRGMATIAGESIAGVEDGDVAVALLALNGVFVLADREGPVEVPAARFLRDPAADLRGGRLVTTVVVPGPPDGAAFERLAVLPSAPSLVSVAAAVSLSGDKCVRVRIAIAGLAGRPARVPEAEAAVEATACDGDPLARCRERIASRAFRGDAHASAEYRRQVAGVLVERAVRRAVAAARARRAAAPRPRRLPSMPATSPIRGFTGGEVSLDVNGAPRRARTRAGATLLELLRAEGFWGVKHGCETGECGACTVLLDGRPVCACIILAARAAGRSIETVEGLGDPDHLHPVQEAFVDTGAIQCGFCTPAMELAAKALIEAVPDPTEDDARDALAGCLCRCTGYVKPVEAVLRAARASSSR